MKISRTLYLTVFIITLFILIACAKTHNIRKETELKTAGTIKEVKILTFNIRMGAGIDNPGTPPRDLISTDQDIERIVQAIQSVGPDIISLQEVAGIKQVKKLAEMLNFNYAYTPHYGEFAMGLAVLSKFIIISSRSKTIYYDDFDSRRALLCEININGKSYSILNVHYHLGEYDNQVKLTLKAISDLNSPLILTGDFNRREWEYELQPILRKYIDTCTAVSTNDSNLVLERGTWRFDLWNRIDYIFIDKKFFKVINSGLVPKEHWNASDHIAYYTHLSLKQ